MIIHFQIGSSEVWLDKEGKDIVSVLATSILVDLRNQAADQLYV